MFSIVLGFFLHDLGVFFRKIYGPHICGDALDIDPTHNHIITGSWRKENVLQVKHGKPPSYLTTFTSLCTLHVFDYFTDLGFWVW